MTVVVWVVEGSWPACVDAARCYAPAGSEILLLHVVSEDLAAVAHGAYAGLLGRAEPGRDPGTHLEDLAADLAESLLEAAAARLGRNCRRERRIGHVETEVLSAAQGAELLILARDGEHGHPGPKSLGPTSRFIVDHATCPLLLVWPAPQRANASPTLPHRLRGQGDPLAG